MERPVIHDVYHTTADMLQLVTVCCKWIQIAAVHNLPDAHMMCTWRATSQTRIGTLQLAYSLHQYECQLVPQPAPLSACHGIPFL